MYWRQGRCLPYGEGVTYWALSEMIKAHAGILETDSAEQVDEKLSEVVAEALDGTSDRQWVEGHLRPLVGRAAEEHGGGDRQSEAFAAWRTILRSARRAQPADSRLRGPPLGGRQPARLRRPPRRLGGRSADARRLHRSPRAPLAPSGLGRREAERGDDLALAALRRRHRAPRPRAPRAVRPPGRASDHAASSARAATRSTPRSSRGWSTSSARTRASSGCPSPCRESSRRASMRSRSRRSSCSRTRPWSGRSSGSGR